MAVADWIAEFYVLHRQRHPGAFLPGEETEEGIDVVEALRANFVHRGIHDFEVANAASQLLLCEEIARPRDHLPALTRLATSIYRQRVESRGGSTSQVGTLADAERASAGCVYCGGDGFAALRLREPRSRYRLNANGEPHRHTGVTPCVCPAGVWYRARWECGPPERQIRTVHLDDVIAGRSRWEAIGG